MSALDWFQEKWHKTYPRIIESAIENEQFSTFYDFPASTRRSVYSTNFIEAFNTGIKRFVKRKERFPNDDALERFLVFQFLDCNQKFSMCCHQSFEHAKPKLLQMFEGLQIEA